MIYCKKPQEMEFAVTSHSEDELIWKYTQKKFNQKPFLLKFGNLTSKFSQQKYLNVNLNQTIFLIFYQTPKHPLLQTCYGNE